VKLTTHLHLAPRLRIHGGIEVLTAALNSWIVVHKELERMWKEAVVAYFNTFLALAWRG
jgi:hypothetical protein